MKNLIVLKFLFLILFAIVLSGKYSTGQQIQKRDTLTIEGIAYDPDKTDSGIEIWRSNSPSPTLKVIGQFGCTGDYSDWQPRAGQVVYRFETQKDGTLPPVVRIFYSKYSEPVLVRLTLDDQVRYFTPENQGSWNAFSVIKCTFKKPILKGKHVLTFYTDGVQYGVMDIARILIIY